MKNIVKVPVALQNLIHTSNELLMNHKNELEDRIQKSNLDMMNILGLDPNEWTLDMDSMVYVKTAIEDHQAEIYEPEL